MSIFNLFKIVHEKKSSKIDMTNKIPKNKTNKPFQFAGKNLLDTASLGSQVDCQYVITYQYVNINHYVFIRNSDSD